MYFYLNILKQNDLWHSYSLTAIMARYFITLVLDIGTFHAMKHMRLSFIARIEYLKWLMPWSRHKKSQQKCNHPNEGHPGQTPHEVYAAMISYTYVWYGHLGQWRHQKKCAKIRYKPRILQWANSPVRPAVCANEVKFWCECKGLPFSGFRSHGVLPE